MSTAFFTPNALQQQTQHFSITLCKCPWTLNSFKFHSFSSPFLTFSPPKHALQPSFSRLLVVRPHVTDQEISTSEQTVSGFSHFRVNDERVVDRKHVTRNVSSVVAEILEKSAQKDRHTGERLDSRKKRGIGSGLSSRRSKDGDLVKKRKDPESNRETDKKKGKKYEKGFDKQLGVEKMPKGAKKRRLDSQGVRLKVELDMCSKKGDVMGALELYDSARRENIVMGQYHYTVLLYLCSSAATGVVQPAKSGSGSGSRSLSPVEPTSEASIVNFEDLDGVGENCRTNFLDSGSDITVSNSGGLFESINNPLNLDRIELDSNVFATEVAKDKLDSSFNGKKSAQVYNGVAISNPQLMHEAIHLGSGDSDMRNITDVNNPESNEIRVSGDFKKYALDRGFEIYERMRLEKVQMNEASLTSVARMALAMGDGDMAFDTVKQMQALGINPRLRSYGPALSAFCNCGDVDKAFAVEQHMLEHGVHPEEPELEVLLRVSIEAGRSDKVYYLLHQLRTGVRKVLPSTADLLEKWFKSKVASKVGKRKLDQGLIREAIENGGGGWHGQGWLGKGKWHVSRTSVGADGLCKCCGAKLATIDLDPTETEKFAESVASIAMQNEKNSSFQKFQKWLDYYGPFEAVVDGANIGLFYQRKFSPSKVNAVVNGIRQMLPSKKWPLIVLHNRRVTDSNMDKPGNKALVEKWKNADALYATPTGSNDDWYWLYAAIKFKCLIVTNDEMRDHLFQLLGNDFFPKWKERHQVHFKFSETGPVFHMPPPCSVVIQESEEGHWHMPIVSEHDHEVERTWLCVTRAKSPGATQVSASVHEELQSPLQKKGRASSDARTETEAESAALNHGNHDKHNSKHAPQEIYRNLRSIISTSVFSSHPTILPQIEAAEKLGSCVIEFEI